MNFSAYPVVRVGVFLILGIIAQPYIRFSGLLGVLTVSLLLFVIWFFSGRYRFFLRFIESALIFVLIFFLGFYLQEQKSLRVTNGELQEGMVAFSCVVVANEGKGFHHSKLIVNYQVTENHADYFPVTKKILVLCSQPDTLFSSYKKSDRILIKGKLRRIKTSTNPGSFDKKAFYFYKGITQEVFIDSLGHQLIQRGEVSFFIRFVDNIKSTWLSKIELWITGKEERAIIKALLLGDKVEIDKDLYNSFSQTGAIHVLAVSGLHVGAVLYLFMYLFRILPKNRWITWIVKPTFISVIALIYVMLTGASPSVIRASVMFVLLLVGREWFRNVHIINILFVSAIWMLIYDPFLIYNLSFQFSYLSLAGIILFYPYIKILFIPPNKVVGYVWDLIAVSLAAQFLVFPLALYYFHQFPVYFILSNIVAVPASLILVNGGILMFLASFIIPLQNTFVPGFYQRICTYLWKSIGFVQELPFAVIDKIWIEPWQVIVLCIIVALLLMYLTFEKPLYFYVTLVLMMVILLSFLLPKTLNSDKVYVSVYETNFGYLADIHADDVAFVFKNQRMNEEQENFLAKNNRIKNKIKKTIRAQKGKTIYQKTLMIQSPLVKAGNKRLLMLGKDFELVKDTIAHVLMVTRGNYRSPFDVLKNTKPKYVILAPDVERYKISSWESCLSEMNIPFWNVRKQGYIRCSLH